MEAEIVNNNQHHLYHFPPPTSCKYTNNHKFISSIKKAMVYQILSNVKDHQETIHNYLIIKGILEKEFNTLKEKKGDEADEDFSPGSPRS